VDVYDPGTGLQLHDLNPSDYAPAGLFWTTEISQAGVSVNPGAGNATMVATDVPIYDYTDLGNALGAQPRKPRTPGKVSFKVVWSGVQQRVNVHNTDPTYGGFAGNFVRNTAQMEWTAITNDYTFVSDPLATSFSAFAEIGTERNGSFFP
jgi:hypothetical protein